MKTRTLQRTLMALVLVLMVAAMAWGATIGGRSIWTMISASELFMDRGIGFTGGMGLMPVCQTVDGVEAVDTDYVLAVTTVPTAAATTVTTGFTDPDCYRSLTVTGSHSSLNQTITITGDGWDGVEKSETFTLAGATTVQGFKPFKTVRKAVIAVDANATGTVSIGIGEKLGLYRPIAADADVVQINLKASAGTAWVVTAAGALPTGAAVDATYDTVDPETTITDEDGYQFLYNAKAW